ncbi:GNAT family N-acetyltransferase [Robiginitalea sp. SC105]|uniref:GNAT family N-acetyltransferase n=1 Tax=Robiginitalea sp. SC105 TaxID=2762332 RepID=UPI0016394D14|nr:GNAT family N-acetyltransferase [Robiginitalea sp. SC105]MBC2839678.1 GNAT family N-acetyltransferase [Robiginitalea sp. SC105]
MTTLRTTSDNPDFRTLVQALNAELAERDGPDHAFYNQFNGVEALNRVVVLIDGTLPVGCGALKEFGAGSVEVKRMYTRPSHRGRGIAGHILELLEAWAWEDGVTRVVLETGKRQPEAIALYQKHGYLRIPNYPPYQGVDNSVCFEKHLEAAGKKSRENLEKT